MGFLDRRRERKLARDFPGKWPAIKAALDRRDESLARAEAAGEWQEEELRLRIHAVEQSPVDLYFRGLMAFCVAVAAAHIANFSKWVHMSDEPPEPQLERFADQVFHDRDKWVPALELLSWAFAARLVWLAWPQRFDQTLEIARAALPAPSQIATQVIAKARAATEDNNYAGFQIGLIRRTYLAAFHVNDEDSSVVVESMVPWEEAWGEAWGFLNDLVEAHFPNGPPAEG